MLGDYTVSLNKISDNRHGDMLCSDTSIMIQFLGSEFPVSYVEQKKKVFFMGFYRYSAQFDDALVVAAAFF
jgi:hypothetical protein